MAHLEQAGWKLEEPLNLATLRRPGKLDAVLDTSHGPVAVEWETGNISSSHRALNKMALGLLKGALAAGVLIVPSRDLYKYLTDRVHHFVSNRRQYRHAVLRIECAKRRNVKRLGRVTAHKRRRIKQRVVPFERRLAD
jgi:hypothetical protein